jgi:hypothetical protein
MSFRFATWAAISVLAGAAACSEGPIAAPQEDARLRLLHATPGLGAVAVELGGSAVIQGVTYGSSSTPVAVPRGRQSIVVRAGSEVLAQFEYTLTTTHVNNLVVTPDSVQFAEVISPDTGTVSSSRANVRMVNVVGPTTVAPTLLDVKVRAPNANPDSVVTFGMDAKVASYGPLMYFDAGHFDFKFLPQGGTQVLAQVAFDVALGETKAVVLERAQDGTYRATVVVER